MKAAEDKNCCEYGTATDSLSSNVRNFEFHKGTATNRGSNSRVVLNSLNKPAPSKWDDAQKWLVGMSNGVDQGHSKINKPRNSNADEQRHAFPTAQKGRTPGEGTMDCEQVVVLNPDEGETKKIDYSESLWRINKPSEDSSMIRSICVRDMGTEMTPIGSQEPSRTATPIRATTPSARSPISSRTSSPGRRSQGVQSTETNQAHQGPAGNRLDTVIPGRASFSGTGWISKDEDESEASKILQKNNSERDRRIGMLEARAVAWDEAERAKYMARYKREEVKIQAWENSQKRRAEAEMRRIEVKAERLKSRAQERLANKLSATHRRADEKRANAEAKMNERAVRTSEKADYIRRTGHLPNSFFSFKLPSFFFCKTCTPI
ncbi:unnamed protein product [Victoria cruziana]